jgi:Pentapeptide repeats (9 copies)
MSEIQITSEIAELADSGRKECKDKAIRNDVVDSKWRNILFVRLVAKGRTFKNVDFKYCIFDSCYFRDSTFDSCDFTGCKFVSTNMHGATFSGCKFDYAIFERTFVDDGILSSSCPGPENLRMRFARTLRMNYQQLGDASAANKAIKIELEATGAHLLKAWYSKESYHRKKYHGLDRLRMFIRWGYFTCLDWIWGNGESVPKLFRFLTIILLAIATIDISYQLEPLSTGGAWNAIVRSPQIFFGITVQKEMSPNWLTAFVVLRLITFGFFMSVIIKRFNRR